MMAEEKVLCISRRSLEGAGLIMQGCLPLGMGDMDGLFRLEQTFKARSLAERDESWKQLIPYQLFVCQGRLLVFQRGGAVGEKRLSGRLSVGIGGHINTWDMAGDRFGAKDLWSAIHRERHEELEVEGKVEERILGLINDDSDEVGRVHLGLVLSCQVGREEQVALKGAEDLLFKGWWTADRILLNEERFEKWSLLAVRLVKEDGPGQVQ